MDTFAKKAAASKTASERGDAVSFDILLVDEASQLRILDALLLVPHLEPKQGRLFVVGDHLQMSPIFEEVYPELDDFGNAAGCFSPRLFAARYSACSETAVAASMDLQSNVMNMLRDNHRSRNRTLGRLVRDVLGYSGFEMCGRGGKCVCYASQLAQGLKQPDNEPLWKSDVLLVRVHNPAFDEAQAVCALLRSFTPPRRTKGTRYLS